MLKKIITFAFENELKKIRTHHENHNNRIWKDGQDDRGKGP